jgi:hypothetical protein
MRFILLLILAICLYGCTDEVVVDFTAGPVFACTNKYDNKDDIIFYESSKSEYLSQSTGVNQYTFIDVSGNRRMLNEYELDNYDCVELTTDEQVNSVLND